MKFLKNVLAVIIGLGIFSLISVLLLIGILGAVGSSGNTKQPLKEASVLRIKLDGPIVDRADEDPSYGLGKLLGKESSIGINKIEQALNHAAEDDNITAVYLEAPQIMAGPASALELRRMIAHFKNTTDKPVYAYSPYYSQLSYFVASAADSVFLNPAGELELKGLSANITFYKGLFDKLGIKPEIFRVGDFKSAVEPYFRKDMSKENRLQYTEMLNGLNKHLIAEISQDRHLSEKEVKHISDSLLVRGPKDALKYHLVDQLYYEDQVVDLLKKASGLEEDDKLHCIGLNAYLNTFDAPVNTSDNKIAVIYADGGIMTGKSKPGTIGSTTIMEELAKARKDDKVKAVVLRVNSPGGSALASDMIWREVKLTKAVKPVIASMGNYAASGGYYISMAADTIVAEPNTITGSIGIFAVLMNLDELLNHKLGVTHDVVKTGAFSDLGNNTRKMTDYERHIIQSGVNRGYETFTSKAAEGRHMPIEQLLKIAGGRVWTGEKAQQLGLVDVMGDLHTAISLAAKKADIEDDYKVSNRPEIKDPFTQFIEEMNEEAEVKIAKFNFGPFMEYASTINRLKQAKGPQARMEFDMEIK
ncbi:signal peptide peptidase SppA [Persicobacter psychrovividus]|uniref:Signal peptide peptidase SppA n=1 Tax=Persicobacter psychrovividus TaxID=387638 RepID=A0ABN6L7L8_9BACT|nr:signal peptide peptidase SppA [Persicobacter psychrovividus]